MNVLITGGAGFIGSHLGEFLLSKGHKIICVDNLFTGKKVNIEKLLDNPNFKFIEHDIVNPLYIEEDIDQIYNLACPASPVHYQHNPVHTIKASTLGVINILGLARLKKAKILQASTSEVYGDPEITPQSEEYRGNVSTVGPRACYDEGKRCAETLFFDYHRMHGMEIKIIRIFNTYGPRMAFNDGRVVSNFVVQALKEKSLTIYGDGSQTRSFCFVDDLVQGIVKMMNTDKKVTGPINLGSPSTEITVKELADEILKLTNSNSNFIFKDLPVDDPKQRCPDITKAKNILNWEPKISTKEGLEKTINNFKERL